MSAHRRSDLARLGWLGVAIALSATSLIAQQADDTPVVASGGSGSAGGATTGATRIARAARLSGAIAIDGRLDEAAWRTAELVSEFRQRQPDEGAPATERTEVRILYDDDALYVGASLFDSRPDSIAGLLARRDQAGGSDEFYVDIDSYFDRRTAFAFSVTPRGVKSDFVISADNLTDYSWDAVWDVAARVDSMGWYAEFRIPLTQLRFSLGAQSAAAPASGDAAELVWGVNFIRWLTRRQEDMQWSLIPRDAAAWVPHYGELRGMRLSRVPRRLEVLPYSLAKVTRAPSEPGDPFYRRTELGGAVGADLKLGVTPNLTLTAALNPDFGQVEADPSEVNLTAFETFFEEKRPFFTEGSDIFRFRLGDFFGQEELFYSRRIGRAPQLPLPGSAMFDDAPVASTILGAAKLSGKTSSGWSLGVLDAVTGAERARYVDESTATRREALVEPLTNYAVARAMRDFRRGQSAIGGILTATTRRSRAGGDSTLVGSSYAGGVDARHRFGRGNYEIDGYVLGSVVGGSEPAIARLQRASAHNFTRPDAGHIAYDSTRTALDGVAALVRARKIGGSWRWGFSARAVSPEFDVNDLGFQQRADALIHFGWVGYEQFRPGRVWRNWWSYLNEWTWGTFGGERAGGGVSVYSGGQLANYWFAFGGLERHVTGLSVDALRGGPALAMPSRWKGELGIDSDQRPALRAGLRSDFYREDGTGTHRLRISPLASLRVAGRADISLSPSVTWNTNTWQYVDRVTTPGDTAYITGHLDQTTAALTARVNYTFTPNLTLQLYAQPFVSAGVYSDFRRVADARAPRFAARFRPVAAGEYAFDDPSFNVRQFNSNAVLRWEYRPGSTLFVVWSQGRELDDADERAGGRFRLRDDTRRLFATSATNILLMKVSYWMSL